MKRVILTVFTILLAFSSWAQATKSLAECSIQIKHDLSAPSCVNGMDASINLKISGAKKPYTVQWSDGGVGEVRSALPAGSYTATVRDNDGCLKKYELQLLQGKPLGGALSIQQSGAAGATRLAVKFADGTKPFAVNIKSINKGVRASWSEYRGEALKQGLYMVEAFTQAGCSQIEKIDLRIQ